MSSKKLASIRCLIPGLGVQRKWQIKIYRPHLKKKIIIKKNVILKKCCFLNEIKKRCLDRMAWSGLIFSLRRWQRIGAEQRRAGRRDSGAEGEHSGPGGAGRVTERRRDGAAIGIGMMTHNVK